MGTSENSVLLTTVQVYTANSIVALMSSDCLNLRFFKEKKNIMVAKMLTSTLLVVLKDVRNASMSTNTRLLQHFVISKNRLNHICRDLEYICSDPTYAVRLLANEVDFGMVFLLKI
jgi:hypothetical protein